MGLRAFEISSWGFVRFHGPDIKTFLQGLLTADLQKLAPGQMLPSCLLTPKGLLTADMELYEETPQTVLAVMRPAAVIGFVKTFTKMMPLSRSDMKCLRSQTAWLVIGEDSQQGLPWPRLIVPARLVLGVDPPAGAELLSAEEFEVLRVAAGMPWYGQDMDETTLPLEARQEAAISLTKGCYMGQETVSRIVHRGHVNRRLALIRYADAAPAVGSPVKFSGGEVGRLSSAAGQYALAMLPVDRGQLGAKCEVLGRVGVAQ